MSNAPTAAVLLIGDELLSGRTRDINLTNIADYLRPLGIPVRECRVVSDEMDHIVSAVNELRARYTYVFTTGGIGPTHDDITADAIATAFGVGIDHHPEVLEFLAQRYKEMGTDFTPARQRMARIPIGASLVKNPVSGAPGFQMENVFTLAGVPQIARAMLEDIGHRLQTGKVLRRLTVQGAGLREGEIAESLGEIAKDFPSLSIGSYPWFRSVEDNGVNLVASGTDEAALNAIEALLHSVVRQGGAEPVTLDGDEA